MEESIVIQLYQYIPNYTANRHLYGHLLLCGIASLTCAHANDLRDVSVLTNTPPVILLFFNQTETVCISLVQ